MLGSEVCLLRPGRVIPLARVGYAEKVKGNSGVYSPALAVLLAAGALTTGDGAKRLGVQWGLLKG
jgi:hypothetical protein